MSTSLKGCDWASPCVIGGTAPNLATFTGLHATTSIQLASGPVFSGTQGTDIHLQSAGTFSSPAAGQQVCLDANFGTTNVGCTGGGFTRISTGTNSSVCSTTSSAGATCTTTVTITPTQADTSYIPSCQGITLTGNHLADVHSLGTSSIVVTISNGTASSATVSTYATLACSAIHP